MQSKINAVIQQAIKEDWFNEMTTSDLQGVCEGRAMNILSTKTLKPIGNRHRAIEIISDKILTGIYDHQK
jgi:hypothetical protein